MMEIQQFLDFLNNKQKKEENQEIREFWETATTIFRLVSMTEKEKNLKASFVTKLNQAKEPWEQGMQMARMMKDEEKIQVGEGKLAAYREICEKLEEL